jgi:hypothetical protein
MSVKVLPSGTTPTSRDEEETCSKSPQDQDFGTTYKSLVTTDGLKR